MKIKYGIIKYNKQSMKKKKTKRYLVQITTTGNKTTVDSAFEVGSAGLMPADKRQVTRQVLNKAETFTSK